MAIGTLFIGRVPGQTSVGVMASALVSSRALVSSVATQVDRRRYRLPDDCLCNLVASDDGTGHRVDLYHASLN